MKTLLGKGMLKIETVGTRLRILRGKQNLEEVATFVGISRQSISKWEKDEALPKIKYMNKLAELYEVDASYISFGIKNPDLMDAASRKIVERLELLTSKQKDLLLENIDQFIGTQADQERTKTNEQNNKRNTS